MRKSRHVFCGCQTGYQDRGWANIYVAICVEPTFKADWIAKGCEHLLHYPWCNESRWKVTLLTVTILLRLWVRQGHCLGSSLRNSQESAFQKSKRVVFVTPDTVNSLELCNWILSGNRKRVLWIDFWPLATNFRANYKADNWKPVVVLSVIRLHYFFEDPFSELSPRYFPRALWGNEQWTWWMYSLWYLSIGECRGKCISPIVVDSCWIVTIVVSGLV